MQHQDEYLYRIEESAQDGSGYVSFGLYDTLLLSCKVEPVRYILSMLSSKLCRSGYLICIRHLFAGKMPGKGAWFGGGGCLSPVFLYLTPVRRGKEKKWPNNLSENAAFKKTSGATC